MPCHARHRILEKKNFTPAGSFIHHGLANRINEDDSLQLEAWPSHPCCMAIALGEIPHRVHLTVSLGGETRDSIEEKKKPRPVVTRV